MIGPYDYLDQAFSDDLLQIPGVPPPAPSELHQLRRMRMNFRLDNPFVRGKRYPNLSKTRFRGNGPAISRSRSEAIAPIIEELRTASKITGLVSLFNFLWSLREDPRAHANHPTNRNNYLSTPNRTAFVRYLPLAFFDKLAGYEIPSSSFDSEVKSLIQNKDNLKILLSKLGTNESPSFYTCLKHAPHLSPRISETSTDLALRVVQELALPGHESATLRRSRRGIVAVIVPRNLLRNFYKPTVIEALDKAYFFLPSRPANRKGKTWRLSKCLTKNDLRNISGIDEWAASIIERPVIHSELTIALVGEFQ